ncbi:MAG: anti-sigma factor antagonist [Frankiales bacterium]|jgi:anti-anti-sigma factor|nr:anti-sigma factor antagonist [Frankiales bacterium]
MTETTLTELHALRSAQRDAADPARVRLELEGEIDLPATLRLQADVDELLEAGVRDFVLDLSDVTFLDSTGLSFLLNVRRRSLAVDGSMAVAAVSPAVFRLLLISGVHRLLLTPEMIEEGMSGGAVTEQPAPV